MKRPQKALATWERWKSYPFEGPLDWSLFVPVLVRITDRTYFIPPCVSVAFRRMYGINRAQPASCVLAQIGVLLRWVPCAVLSTLSDSALGRLYMLAVKENPL